MKKQSENTFASFSKEYTENLTTVVKETLAVEFTHLKTFSTADLWNIQRRGRTMYQRRFLA